MPDLPNCGTFAARQPKPRYQTNPMKQILSPHNTQLKHLAKLAKSAKYRRESRQTVLEGAHLLDALLQTGARPQQVYVAADRLDDGEIQGLLARLAQEDVTAVGGGLLAKASTLSDGGGLLALADIPAAAAAPQNGDCVVLERIQDPGNIGTILRSAAAAGVKNVVLGRDCADVWSPKVLRAAMGAHFLLGLYPDTDLAQWLPLYREPLRVTALDESAQSLYALDLRRPCGWLFGNEGSGVSDEARRAAADSVVIPMAGATESLNVAMAATVCLFEQMRQRL